ncbi:MAG: hypothetical protein AAGB48_12960 [Planctomycetota bacterium]
MEVTELRRVVIDRYRLGMTAEQVQHVHDALGVRSAADVYDEAGPGQDVWLYPKGCTLQFSIKSAAAMPDSTLTMLYEDGGLIGTEHVKRHGAEFRTYPIELKSMEALP